MCSSQSSKAFELAVAYLQITKGMKETYISYISYISLNFYGLSESPSPQEIPIPSVRGYGYFLKMHIKAFFVKEMRDFTINSSLDVKKFDYVVPDIHTATSAGISHDAFYAVPP